MSKIEQLKEILQILNKDTATKGEIASTISGLVKSIKDLRSILRAEISSSASKTDSKIKEISLSIKASEEKFKSLLSELKPGGKADLRELERSINAEIQSLSDRIDSIKEFDSKELEDKISEIRDSVESIKPLTGVEIVDLLENLQGEYRLDKSAIKGLEELEKKIGQNPVSFVSGPRGIEIYASGVLKGRSQYINFIAGSGISITANTVGERLDLTFNASGSGAFSVLSPTSGTIDDTNTVFGFDSQPTLVIINGAAYQSTGGAITWTWNSDTSEVTLSAPVGSGGSIYALA